ncbi:MAG TPA: methionyl-tRNA formyltransferase [Ignavibacteria bacterium]
MVYKKYNIRIKDKNIVNKVLFIGSKHLGLSCLKIIFSIEPKSLAAIVTLNDTIDIRCKLKEFKSFAEQKKKKLYILEKQSGLKDIIEKEKPDLCIVVGWYWKISPEILSSVPNGFIGLHASLLPKYRGFAPLVWAIINGEKRTGISLFYLEDGIDTGNIIGQKQFTISQTDSIRTVLEKSEIYCDKLLKENYLKILSGNASKKSQTNSYASYCSERKPEDGLINWTDSNKNIYNFIRAQSEPYPGAFTYIDSKKIRIWKANIFPYPYHGIPGTIIQINSDSAVVVCGQGALILNEVQFEEQNKCPAQTVLKYGIRFK